MKHTQTFRPCHMVFYNGSGHIIRDHLPGTSRSLILLTKSSLLLIVNPFLPVRGFSIAAKYLAIFYDILPIPDIMGLRDESFGTSSEMGYILWYTLSEMVPSFFNSLRIFTNLFLYVVVWSFFRTSYTVVSSRRVFSFHLLS